MTLVRSAAARIHECDLYKREDLVYGESYFTDKFAEIAQICVDSEKTAAVKSGNSHKKRFAESHLKIAREELIANVASRTRTQAGATLQSQNRNLLSPITKRSMITRRATGSSSQSASTRVLEEQQKRAFIKPPVQAQQRQHLEIQTQSLVQPLFYPQENLPVMGSSFTIDQRTNNAVAQAQYHNYRVYRNGGSEVLPSSAPFSVQAAVYHLPPTPVSAGTAKSAGFVLPPAVTPASAANFADSAAAKGPASVSVPGAEDGQSRLICSQCDKKFPRRCDLT